MAAGFETECGTCRRVVGVVQRLVLGREDRDRGTTYKLAVHAAVGANEVPEGIRRPRCSGSGLEVPALVLIPTNRTADQRKRDQAGSRAKVTPRA